jgi:hypothetical protein
VVDFRSRIDNSAGNPTATSDNRPVALDYRPGAPSAAAAMICYAQTQIS